MRECHPSKEGAEAGDQRGVVLWSQACSLLPAASCGLGPGQLEVPFSAFTPMELGAPAPSPRPS